MNNITSVSKHRNEYGLTIWMILPHGEYHGVDIVTQSKTKTEFFYKRTILTPSLSTRQISGSISICATHINSYAVVPLEDSAYYGNPCTTSDVCNALLGIKSS